MSRIIQPALVEYIDGKLKNNGIAQHAFETKDARLLYQQANSAFVGIREKTGNNDGPLVELLQETIGSASQEAWCMSAQQSALAYAELKTGIKSPIFASEHCLTVWTNTPKEQRVKFTPLAGAMVIWRHGNTQNGHTGCVWSADEAIFTATEGNTTGGVDPNGKVVRDGSGFYFTKRSRAGNGDMHVVGFLKPF